MIQICPQDNCTGCGMCVNICPAKSITKKENHEGFLYPLIDQDKCVDCGLCQRRCPAIHDTRTGSSVFYMAWHKDKSVLMDSSSGGVFTALAHYVFRQGGVVFGAIRDPESREVYHCCARNDAELSVLRSSKYYQSNLKDAYKQVKEFLEKDTYVLFTGTACQIAGLYAFLGKDDIEYLITADVLCHGVASKKIVDEYIASKEKQFKKKIKTIVFRVKDMKTGWYSGRMKLEFDDGSLYVSEKGYDTFFVGFNRNDFLRESCYSCKYCGTDRVADFTMGDFWGCDFEKIPAEQKTMGVSLLLCNSTKAQRILEGLKEEMVIQSIEPQEAIPYNRALREPQYRPEDRDRFFELMEKKGYDHTVKKLHWKRYFRFGVKNVLKKVLPHGIAKKIIKSM